MDGQGGSAEVRSEHPTSPPPPFISNAAADSSTAVGTAGHKRPRRNHNKEIDNINEKLDVLNGTRRGSAADQCGFACGGDRGVSESHLLLLTGGPHLAQSLGERAFRWTSFKPAPVSTAMPSATTDTSFMPNMATMWYLWRLNNGTSPTPGEEYAGPAGSAMAAA